MDVGSRYFSCQKKKSDIFICTSILYTVDGLTLVPEEYIVRKPYHSHVSY